MPRKEWPGAGDLSAAAAGAGTPVVDGGVDVGDRVAMPVGHGLTDQRMGAGTAGPEDPSDDRLLLPVDVLDALVRHHGDDCPCHGGGKDGVALGGGACAEVP